MSSIEVIALMAFAILLGLVVVVTWRTAEHRRRGPDGVVDGSGMGGASTSDCGDGGGGGGGCD